MCVVAVKGRVTTLGGFYMGRQGTPRDNNDGIVLALAPARSARGIREALISYPHFFFYLLLFFYRNKTTLIKPFPRFYCTERTPHVIWSLVVLSEHSSEDKRADGFGRRTGIYYFVLFLLPVLGVTSYASCPPINHVSCG